MPRSALLVTLLASAAAYGCALTVSAPVTAEVRGYGHYPCQTTAECTAQGLGSCQQDAVNGGFFCGIDGASCTADPATVPQRACDGGTCYAFSSGGRCLGGFDNAVPGNGPCLGSLGKNANRVCGVKGSFCGTVNQHGAQSYYDALDQNCNTQYCNAGTLLCGVRAAVGESCAFDPIRGCQAGLFPNIDVAAGTCVCLTTPQPGPSARARARARERRNLASLCPASHTACSVGSAGAYECIDTSSNLEQCGGCATDGGVDCTALEGVSAVGCIEGLCEIWRCEDQWRFDASSNACVRE